MRLITSLIASLLFFQYAYAIKLGELELQKEQPSGVKLVVPVKNINYDGYSTLSLKVRSDNKTINKMQFAINKVNKDSITLNSLEKIVIDKPIGFKIELKYKGNFASRIYQLDNIGGLSKEISRSRKTSSAAPIHIRAFEQTASGYIEGKIYLDGITEFDKQQVEVTTINGDSVDVYIDETFSKNQIIYIANEQFYSADTSVIAKVSQGQNTYIKSFQVKGGNGERVYQSVALSDENNVNSSEKNKDDLTFYMPSLLNEPVKQQRQDRIKSKNNLTEQISEKVIESKINTVVYHDMSNNDLNKNQSIESQMENVYVNWSYQIREMPPIMKNIMGEQN